MSENINEELKASLREYAEWAESHIYEVPIVLPDCLAYAACRIEGLEAQIVDLNKTLEQVKHERDAAIADLKDALDRGDAASFCEFCNHSDDWGKCEHPCNPYSGETGWEWRGVPKEEA